MAPKKISPNRRKSIAGTNQNSPSIVPKGRRRAHSIVPSANLSPLAKARRSLVPRKSILKAFVNVLNVDPSSQQSASSSQAANGDDANATRSMDMTQEFAQPIHVHDDTRKSIGGRRVGFSRESHVRVFDSRRRSSTQSPRSSDVPAPSPAVQSDENDYPGQNTRRRRSSLRMSMAGSEDMDMTTVIEPGAFQNRGSAILDEEFDFDEEEEYGNDDMDVTEVIHGGFARKRSLSMGGRRQSLPQAEAEQSFEGDESRSDIGNQSAQSIVSDSASERSHIMEFTIPLGQSLRPAQQDDVWLALKQMTHSGGEPDEPEESFEEENSLQEEGEMELDDAMERLRRARDSLPLSQGMQDGQIQEDSFTNTEDSFDNDEDEVDGNKTLNLSRVMGRPSIGLNSRMSMGYDSNMDESEVYGNVVGPNQSTPRQSLAPQPQPSQTEEASAPLGQPQQPAQPRKSLVFQPPPQEILSQQDEPSQQSEPAPQPRKSTGSFSFTPRAASPSKAAASPAKPKPRPTFSAAFAPPVARPSPKKPAPVASTSAITPAKRPYSTSSQDDVENMDIDQPSPAKRQALASKWLDAAEAPKEKDKSLSPVANKIAPLPTPRPLSPAKKAPFQANANENSETEASAPPSALRRPSGYFAKRKSMAVSFNVPPIQQAISSTAGSTKKNPGIGKGRASVGAVPANPWKRTGPAVSKEATTAPIANVEAEPPNVVREAERQPSPSPQRNQAAFPDIHPTEISHRDSPETVSQFLPEAELNVDDAETSEAELSGRMEIDTDATRQWREGVEQTEYEEEEVPSISVAQFFSITGIKFMDELTAPRRSIHPSQQPLRQARNPSEIPLAEYVTAMAIDIPQLELYSRVSKDLEAWMAQSKVVFAQAEEEAAKVTPELFVEYARADEEGQAELLHQLNLIRTHTRYLARSDWYDWKLQWVEGLRVTADEAFASLENDARKLEEPKKTAAEVIPELEKEYEDLMRELEHEQAEIAEVEASDQEHLNDLKATIAEQNIEIETLKAELAEGTEQVRSLKERSEELEFQKREAANTIATAERVLRMKQSSTRSEVFRLKDELEALEDLHMFRIVKVSADMFEYTYSSLFLVSIPCKNFRPVLSKVNITRYGRPNARYKDEFPKLSTFLLTAAKELIVQSDDDITVREIVHRLNDYWSSCAQLRSQLILLGIKYPIEISIPPLSSQQPGTLSSFKARATVMFPSAQAKAYISFVFSPDTYSRWPLAIEGLDCEVEVAYGPIERNAIMEAVMARLSQATPSESYACLLDACIEAQDVYH